MQTIMQKLMSRLGIINTQLYIHPYQNGGSVVPALSRHRARRSIYPLAMLDLLSRKGHSWGLLSQYEEARLAKSLQAEND